MMALGGWVMIIGTIITVTAFGPGEPNGNVGGFVQFIIGRVVRCIGSTQNFLPLTLRSLVLVTERTLPRSLRGLPSLPRRTTEVS